MNESRQLVVDRLISMEPRSRRSLPTAALSAVLHLSLLLTPILVACSDLEGITALDELFERTESVDESVEGSGVGRASRSRSADVPEGAHGDLSEDLIDELADDGFQVDLTAMAALPCHVMFDIIMGDCTAEDVSRVAAEALLQRDAAGEESKPAAAADFIPGDLDPDLDAHPRQPTTTFDLQNGARIPMKALLTDWEVGGVPIRGYGYNAQVPGPVIKVPQGASIAVDFTNGIDLPTTIHWHGLRHDNAHDGVPDVTQPSVMPGETWQYILKFPDAGAFWYHPHVREDIQQDAGLYGVILVEPSNPSYFNSVDREEVIILDDIFIEDGAPVPYGNDHTNFAVMGRFGTRMLVNGRPDYTVSVTQGEVVRFHVANVSNVRPFKLTFDGAPMRLVGSDLGKYVIEDFVDGIVVAPAERYTVEVLFEEGRSYRLLNETPERNYVIGNVFVTPDEQADGANAAIFAKRKLNAEVLNDIERFRDHFDRDPDVEFVIDVEVDGLVLSPSRPSETGSDGDAGHVDDHEHSADELLDDDHEHPDEEVIADESENQEGEQHDDEQVEVDHVDAVLNDEGGHATIEWEDEMLAANRQAFGGRDVRWIIRDTVTGAENEDLAYTYRVGDVVKMRWVNDAGSAHPMQHPIHIHGQRFLITAIDGEPVPDEDLVWKDTFLMPIGASMDVVMDVTNPGSWMAHCHIAEHLETGMMFHFMVME